MEKNNVITMAVDSGISPAASAERILVARERAAGAVFGADIPQTALATAVAYRAGPCLE